MILKWVVLIPYRLSGLIIDVFGDVAVVASSAAWVEKYKSEIEACIRKINYINHINWRPSVDILKEDGVDVSDLKEMHSSTCPERTKVCNDPVRCCSSEFHISFTFFCLGFFIFFSKKKIFMQRLSLTVHSIIE